MNDDLTNLVGLSNRLRLPCQWLKSKAEAGRIPSLRVGRRRLFSVSAVRSAIANLAACDVLEEAGDTESCLPTSNNTKQYREGES